MTTRTSREPISRRVPPLTDSTPAEEPPSRGRTAVRERSPPPSLFRRALSRGREMLPGSNPAPAETKEIVPTIERRREVREPFLERQTEPRAPPNRREVASREVATKEPVRRRHYSPPTEEEVSPKVEERPSLRRQSVSRTLVKPDSEESLPRRQASSRILDEPILREGELPLRRQASSRILVESTSEKEKPPIRRQASSRTLVEPVSSEEPIRRQSRSRNLVEEASPPRRRRSLSRTIVDTILGRAPSPPRRASVARERKEEPNLEVVTTSRDYRRRAVSPIQKEEIIVPRREPPIRTRVAPAELSETNRSENLPEKKENIVVFGLETTLTFANWNYFFNDIDSFKENNDWVEDRNIQDIYDIRREILDNINDPSKLSRQDRNYIIDLIFHSQKRLQDVFNLLTHLVNNGCKLYLVSYANCDQILYLLKLTGLDTFFQTSNINSSEGEPCSSGNKLTYIRKLHAQLPDLYIYYIDSDPNGDKALRREFSSKVYEYSGSNIGLYSDGVGLTLAMMENLSKKITGTVPKLDEKRSRVSVHV